MTATTPQLTHTAPRSATARPTTAARSSSTPDRPTWGEAVAATVALIGAPAFFGPPIIFLLGPWLLIVLLLIPPAAFLITLALVVVVTAGLLAALVALVASPYLLVRHLRARHEARRRRFALAPHLSSVITGRPQFAHAGHRHPRQAARQHKPHLPRHRIAEHVTSGR